MVNALHAAQTWAWQVHRRRQRWYLRPSVGTAAPACTAQTWAPMHTGTPSVGNDMYRSFIVHAALKRGNSSTCAAGHPNVGSATCVTLVVHGTCAQTWEQQYLLQYRARLIAAKKMKKKGTMLISSQRRRKVPCSSHRSEEERYRARLIAAKKMKKKGTMLISSQQRRRSFVLIHSAYRS